MARRHAGEEDRNDGLIDRRTYLKLASAAGTLATTGLVGSVAAQSQEADTSEVVNLGDVGLSEGDVIDPYFDEYFRDGTEVRVPAGEYDWEGGGLGNPSGDAALVGEGEVILHTVESEFYNNIRATSGTVELRNLTVRGSVRNETRIRVETGPDGRILVDNVNFPDGSVDDTGRAQALYVPSEHEGLVEFRNCYVARFSDNGIYASSSGKGGGGRVLIDHCVAHNNNISGFRIGGVGSAVQNSVVINDARSPVPSGISHNQRGIRIDNSDYSQEMEIRNCDIIHSGSDLGNGGPIRWSPRAHGSSGHIENVRIRNDVDIEAIGARRDATENWTGNDIHLTGDGDLDVPSWFENVTTGADAEAPTPSLDDLPADGSGDDGSDGDDGDGGSGDDGDSGNGSGGDDGSSGTVLEFVTAEATDLLEYEFTAGGQVTPLYGRTEYAADEGEVGESATEHDDGTWTGSGALSGTAGGGDAFAYEGDVLALEVTTGDASALTLYRDGTEVTRDELVVDDGSDGDDGSNGDDGSDGDDGTDGTGDLASILIVDGTASEDVTTYQFAVTGEVERDQALSSTPADAMEVDAIDDTVGNAEVEGIVGKGVDGYRYSGSLVDFQFSGKATLTVERASE